MNNTLYVDSTNCPTELCRIAAKHNTDKSPFTPNSPFAGHRKGYTAVYEMLFSSMRNKLINFCEIGIEDGGSLQTFSEYFPNARLFGMELLENKIELCENLNIPRATILKTDVSDKNLLNSTFRSTNQMFDIIIDDSSHQKDHQRNIIEVASKYLKPSGIMIVEDLFRNDEENIFDSVVKDQFSFHCFITCHHENRISWDNDKIWFGIKR
jgi:hypothetical protein